MCRSMNYRPLSTPTFAFNIVEHLYLFPILSVTSTNVALRAVHCRSTTVHLDKCTSQAETETQVSQTLVNYIVI